MARNDGRIEAGQKLAGAISARAWNRAQEAADRVLGAGTGFGAGAGIAEPGRLVVPCLVTSTVSGVLAGHVVKIDDASVWVSPARNDSEDKRSATVSCLSGSVVVPVSLANYADAKVELGAIVSGATMPKPGAPAVVNVCIAGMCICRVRPRFEMSGIGYVGKYKFIQASVLRAGDSADPLTGAAEASSCGHHRIIRYLTSANGVASYAVVIL
jgi:hypothetical protein